MGAGHRAGLASARQRQSPVLGRLVWPGAHREPSGRASRLSPLRPCGWARPGRFCCVRSGAGRAQPEAPQLPLWSPAAAVPCAGPGPPATPSQPSPATNKTPRQRHTTQICTTHTQVHSLSHAHARVRARPLLGFCRTVSIEGSAAALLLASALLPAAGLSLTSGPLPPALYHHLA